MVLVGDRRPEQGHDAVAGVLVNCSFEAMDTVSEDLEEAVEQRVPLFQIWSAASSIEPFISAKSTVTCLRSPSRALREVRIFSAGCLGV